MSEPLPSRHFHGHEAPGTVSAPNRRPFPGQRSPRHLAIVENPTRRRSGVVRARLLLGGGAVLAVMVAFALVYLHVVTAQRQFRLDSLSAHVAKQEATYSRLRLQVAQLDSPQQIIATAEGKLGMLQPSSVIYLSPSVPLPAGATGTGAGGIRSGVTDSGALSPAVAPAGDADWPRIKSQLAGGP